MAGRSVDDMIPTDRAQLLALLQRCERLSSSFYDPAFKKALDELGLECRSRLASLAGKTAPAAIAAVGD